MTTKFQECSRCVLDTNDDPIISFDNEGVCSHCRGYEKRIGKLPNTEVKRIKFIEDKFAEIKKEGEGKEFDCIMGLSGGVDSSYLAILVKDYGLRPLIVHFDNGWNSELAVANIESIVNTLDLELYTYVVNWNEFKKLQLSYIRSGVLDWEIPSDHGFYATLFEQAHKRKIKYILGGHNVVTEGILPKCMRWNKMDVANIKDINSKYSNHKLKTYPTLSFFKSVYYSIFMNYEILAPLNYFPYNKDEAKRIITEKLGWRDYGGKHYESIFTRFYQGYVLREKFGYDKRKAHLATLINSGQINKRDAIEELKQPAYAKEQFLEDKDYVLKKLGMSSEEFEEIISKEPVDHLDYKSYVTGLYVRHRKFMQAIKPLTSIVKKVLGK